MKREVVFIYPIIRTDYIEKSLETLFKYTDPEKFRVIVVDQSIEGISKDWSDFLYETGHLYIRMQNQGFSKAANEGIVHALRWEVPYIAIVNDDTEFMYDGWWEDLLKEFDTDPNILAVCPESPRVPLWGYGRPHKEYIDLVEYKNDYSKEDIDFLKSGLYEKITDRYPIEPLGLGLDPIEPDKPNWNGKIYIPVEKRSGQPNQGKPIFPGISSPKAGVIDAIAMWMPVFKREAFLELGLFEERYVWGGGEDYDMNARAYSCAWPIERDICDEMYHKRMVSTMKSWVWHWWGQSKDIKEKLDPKLFEGKRPWNNGNELWKPEDNNGHGLDVWGHYTDEEGVKRPIKRVKEVQVQSL